MTVKSETKSDVLDIVNGAREVLAASLIAIEATDDTALADALLKSSIFAIEQALAKASPLRDRTARLHDAARVAKEAIRLLDRDWHSVTNEDTVEGRSLATYSLVARLTEARAAIVNFLED